MTDAPHLSNAPEPDWADQTEQSVLDAARRLAPTLGWNAAMVRAACAEVGLSEGDQELLLPNDARDLAARAARSGRRLCRRPCYRVGMTPKHWRLWDRQKG